MINPIKFIVIHCLRAYKRLISPLLGQNCRFHPSCASYAIEAIEVHGLISGLVLSIKRLIKCHPWNPGGVDLVPEMNSTRKS